MMTGKGKKYRRVIAGGMLLAVFLLGMTNLALATGSRPRMPDPSQIQANAQDDPGTTSAAPIMPQATSSASMKEYVLGVGDRLRLTVYGEDDLSGEYEVNSNGQVALPLIGSISLSGKTVHQFEEAVRTKLSGGYLRDPRVSVQVANYRPFFILGEVTKPGSYPYVNGMNILNAVALAGGYTYRADKDGVIIVHANDPNKTEQKAPEDSTVMPGDIIRVPERFF
jgi:protein involved in polysaccharide export with SLBB domain